jgi:hypothetical protein
LSLALNHREEIQGMSVSHAPYGGKAEADGLSDPREASRLSASERISMGAVNTPEKPQRRASLRIDFGRIDADDTGAAYPHRIGEFDERL